MEQYSCIVRVVGGLCQTRDYRPHHWFQCAPCRRLAPTRAYSTGLLEGLTNINRIGNVEVQVASNVTLVRT